MAGYAFHIAFEVCSAVVSIRIRSVLAQCAVWICIMPFASILLPVVFSVAWASLTSATTSYFYIRFLRWNVVGLATSHICPWAGWSRAPRQLLKTWVAHSRPAGCPQMTWGRALENALKLKGISKEFDELFAIAIAKDRPKWRQQTHSNPASSDAWWLMDTTWVNDHNCFMQKGTQPNQTCSEGCTFQYYCTSMV